MDILKKYRRMVAVIPPEPESPPTMWSRKRLQVAMDSTVFLGQIMLLRDYNQGLIEPLIERLASSTMTAQEREDICTLIGSWCPREFRRREEVRHG